MTSKHPNILITNDDGIHASGIKQLWQAVQNMGFSTVVAPAHEQSAVGMSTTLRQPLHIQKVRWNAHENEELWSVTGTPSDCVKLGLNAIIKQRPDIVLSGINRGTNVGKGLLYTDTVAAAIESILQGIPAIAFSFEDYLNEPDYRYLSKYIVPIVQHVLKHPLPKGSFLNVNFPESSRGPIQGFKMTQQGSEWWAEDPEKRNHPIEGQHYYWLGSKLIPSDKEEEEGGWLRRGYVTAVPVHVGDLTDRAYLRDAHKHFEDSFISD